MVKTALKPIFCKLVCSLILGPEAYSLNGYTTTNGNHKNPHNLLIKLQSKKIKTKRIK